MTAARLIVCEHSHRWAVAVRWAIAADAAESGGRSPSGRWCAIEEAQDLAECWQMLRRAPSSVLAVEIRPASSVELLRGMAELPHRFPRAAVIVLGPRAEGAPLTLWRELGAIHFVDSPREIETVLRLVRRHMQQFPDAYAGIHGRIWQQLPWPTGPASASGSLAFAGTGNESEEVHDA